MNKNELPDFLNIYEKYRELKPGSKAELRRVVNPRDLIEVPAFYRLLGGSKGNEQMQRVIYCLPVVKHQDSGVSLGHALAKASASEKRLFMVIRSEAPNDLIQLRRLLKMVEPTVDWPQTAKALYYWNDLAKRTLLEDYFYYQNTSNTL